MTVGKMTPIEGRGRSIHEHVGDLKAMVVSTVACRQDSPLLDFEALYVSREADVQA